MLSVRNQSPRNYRVAGYLLVIAVFVGLGGWSALAQLDSAVIAPGTIVLEGNRRLVQHLEGGLVEQVYVVEGQTVKRGQLLFKMTDVQAQGNVEVLFQRMGVARIVEARLVAEQDLKSEVDFSPFLDVSSDNQFVEEVEDQRSIFNDRRSILASKSEILESRQEQLNAEVSGLEVQRDAIQRRVQIQSVLLNRYRTAGERGVIESNILAQHEDDFIQIEAELGSIMTEIARTYLALTETALVVIQQRQEFKERAGAEIEEVRLEIGELEERLIIAQDILERTDIRAEVDGTVQNVRVFTAGAVVSPGMVLAEVVPNDERLIVAAAISPQDIDNIRVGLETEIRFTAFSDQIPKLTLGSLETISRNTITPEGTGQSPYYMARFSVDDYRIPEEIRSRITAGMPVDVIIKTGERTVLAYLLEPLTDIIRKSMRED